MDQLPSASREPFQIHPISPFIFLCLIWVAMCCLRQKTPTQSKQEGWKKDKMEGRKKRRKGMIELKNKIKNKTDHLTLKIQCIFQIAEYPWNNWNASDYQTFKKSLFDVAVIQLTVVNIHTAHTQMELQIANPSGQRVPEITSKCVLDVFDLCRFSTNDSLWLIISLHADYVLLGPGEIKRNLFLLPEASMLYAP